MRNDFRIRFGNECHPVRFQLLLDLRVIFDDAIVHHHDFSVKAHLGMRIPFGRSAMCRPARVRNPDLSRKGMRLQLFFQGDDLPRRLFHFESSVRMGDSDARRIVSAIFQAF